MIPGARNLRLTGPTPLPPAVLAALQRQVVGHRSTEFKACLGGVVERLRPLFGGGTLLPFTASGTGGLEAVLVNTVSPGDRVLAVSTGYFGDRFAEIARAFGADVRLYSVPWGQAADPDELRRRVRAIPALTAALLTHSETSTGVLNPLPQLADAVRAESDALLLADGVSSIGATPFRLEEWGLDAVVTVSQKALMAPPGMAIVAAGARALEAARRGGASRYYFDFSRMAEAVAEGRTTYTPAICTIYAIEAALGLLEEEGLPCVFERHRALAERCRREVAALGLECFADPAHASPSLTAFLAPPHRSASELRRALEERHGLVISGGRGDWGDRMLRVGHMGYVSSGDLSHFLEALTTEVRT